MEQAKIRFKKQFVSGLLKGLTHEDIITTVHPEQYLVRYQNFIANETVLGGTMGTSKYIVTSAEILK